MNEDETANESATDDELEEGDPADETEEATGPTPVLAANATAQVERVGSSRASATSDVFECSLGDFNSRLAADVVEHINDKHVEKPKGRSAKH